MKRFFTCAATLACLFFVAACSSDDNGCDANASYEVQYERLYSEDAIQQKDGEIRYSLYQGMNRGFEAAYAVITLDDGRSADLGTAVKDTHPFDHLPHFSVKTDDSQIILEEKSSDLIAVPTAPRKVQRTKLDIRSNLQTDMLEAREISMTAEEKNQIQKAMKGTGDSNVQLCSSKVRMFMLQPSYKQPERSLVLRLQARYHINKTR